MTYSQVHKYWDMDTILLFLALYTITMDLKWNKQTIMSLMMACITDSDSSLDLILRGNSYRIQMQMSHL